MFFTLPSATSTGTFFPLANSPSMVVFAVAISCSALVMAVVPLSRLLSRAALSATSAASFSGTTKAFTLVVSSSWPFFIFSRRAVQVLVAVSQLAFSSVMSS